MMLPQPSRSELPNDASVLAFQAYDIPIFCVMGAFGGACGAFFNMANRAIVKWRISNLKSKRRRMLEVIIITSCVVGIGFAIPAVWPDCVPKSSIPNLMDVYYQLERFTCAEGDYSRTASIFYASSYEVLSNIFHNLGVIHYGQLALFFFIYCSTCCWTMGSAIPSGLFVPSMLMGAIYGRFVGEFMRDLNGETYSSPMFSLVGAVSFLAGTTRITIALVAIAVESSNDLVMTLPALLAVLFAKIVGDRICDGNYEVIIAIKGVPYLEPEPEDKAVLIECADVMSTALVCIPRQVKLEELLHVLRWTTHSSFPVVSDKEHRTYVGLCHRDYLTCLLSLGPRILHMPGHFPPNPEHLHRFANELFPAFPSLRRATDWLAENHLEMEIDLTPYIAPCAHTLRSDASMARAHHLFVSTGLRSLPILASDRTSCEVVGIITRADLLHESYERGLDRAIEREKTWGSRLLDPKTPTLLKNSSHASGLDGLGSPNNAKRGQLRRNSLGSDHSQ